MLRLAAGGFRDMTRIASGHPGIWPDICLANRDAIVGALDAYLDALTRVRDDRRGRRPRRAARRCWPTHARRAATCPPACRSTRRWSSCASRCPTARACIAEVTTLAARFGVNIADLEIAHSLEGARRCARAASSPSATSTRSRPRCSTHGYHVARTPLA